MIHVSALSKEAEQVLETMLKVVERYQEGERKNLTIDCEEFNKYINPEAMGPFYDEQAIVESIDFCKHHEFPLLPLLLVISEDFRRPENKILMESYGSKPFKELSRCWKQSLKKIENLDDSTITEMYKTMDLA